MINPDDWKVGYGWNRLIMYDLPSDLISGVKNINSEDYISISEFSRSDIPIDEDVSKKIKHECIKQCGYRELVGVLK